MDWGQVPKEALEEGEEWHRKDSNDMAPAATEIPPLVATPNSPTHSQV